MNRGDSMQLANRVGHVRIVVSVRVDQPAPALEGWWSEPQADGCVIFYPASHFQPVA